MTTLFDQVLGYWNVVSEYNNYVSNVALTNKIGDDTEFK